MEALEIGTLARRDHDP